MTNRKIVELIKAAKQIREQRQRENHGTASIPDVELNLMRIFRSRTCSGSAWLAVYSRHCSIEAAERFLISLRLS
jgi:hypothetical protein